MYVPRIYGGRGAHDAAFDLVREDEAQVQMY